MDGCEYKHNDGVINYCVKNNKCEYKDNTLIKQVRETLMGKHKLYEFPACGLPNKEGIESLIRETFIRR